MRAALMLAFVAAPALAATCESLATLSLPDTTITLAQPVTGGAFVPPASAPGKAAPSPLEDLPAFCRVAATLRPSPDSDIKIEVWMPVSGWNGKFQAVGNGGWSGNIVYPGMAQALRRGYATSSTDTGHTGGSGSFALGHPEKLIDFGWRSEHEMTVKAKAIIAAYYGGGPRFSYWVGCSSGGKQGLMEAQRFPADYDGIVAGAPANYWTHLMVSFVWAAHATFKDPQSYIPPAKYPLLHKAALEACDALDGVRDGVIEDPPRCRFDPKVLTCQEGLDSSECLTPRQVEAARKIYAGATNPRTGRQIFPGLVPGSELGWGPMTAGPKLFSIPDDHFKYVVFRDPAWDFRNFNFDTDVALTDKLDNGTLNAVNPDLRKFASRGGKLLAYHGWNDQLIAAGNSVNYYTSVLERMGGRAKTAGWFRLFMAPGVNHCRGGEGPDTFDALAAVEEWVEKGVAPDRLIASRRREGKVDRTRPLCPYPQVARYKGSGSSDDAANFACVSP
jgi:feruloyl esterase